MAISKLFSTKLDATQIAKVVEVAQKLNIEPNWLLAVMYFETGKTFSPTKTNSIGSVGLIQFTRDKAGVNYKTIGGKRYNLSDIGKMSFIKQMDLVQDYYKDVMKMTGKNIKSFVETYLVTFFPNALGQVDNYVFETKGLSRSLIAKQNPIFDLNKDGTITKIEVENSFKKWYGAIFQTEINVKKKTNLILSKMKEFFLKYKKPIMIVGGILALVLGVVMYRKYAKK